MHVNISSLKCSENPRNKQKAAAAEGTLVSAALFCFVIVAISGLWFVQVGKICFVSSFVLRCILIMSQLHFFTYMPSYLLPVLTIDILPTTSGLQKTPPGNEYDSLWEVKAKLENIDTLNIYLM